MSEQTNGSGQGQPGQQRTPTFVGGAFGVTGREVAADAADDPVAAFTQIEGHEDTEPGTETAQEAADVEGTTSQPSPGERNEPV